MYSLLKTIQIYICLKNNHSYKIENVDKKQKHKINLKDEVGALDGYRGSIKVGQNKSITLHTT